MDQEVDFCEIRLGCFFPKSDDGVAVAWQGSFSGFFSTSLLNKNKYFVVRGSKTLDLGCFF